MAHLFMYIRSIWNIFVVDFIIKKKKNLLISRFHFFAQWNQLTSDQKLFNNLMSSHAQNNNLKIEIKIAHFHI